MNDLINHLQSQGIGDIEDLLADISKFFDDPELFNQLPAAERQAYEARVDAALSAIAM